jgi:hypothetical protein
LRFTPFSDFDKGSANPYDYCTTERTKERAMSSCEQIRKNLKGCTCTYTSCERRGACCACVAFHRDSGELPGCFFPADAEKTYDRSVRKYVQVMKDWA